MCIGVMYGGVGGGFLMCGCRLGRFGGEWRMVWGDLGVGGYV